MTLVKSVTSAGVIPSDRLGRLLVRAEQRCLILEAFDASSLSAMAFARQHGLYYSTFANWVKKRRKDVSAQASPVARATTADRPVFAEVLVRETKTAPDLQPSLKVNLSCGVSLKISDPIQMPLVIELVQALAASRPC